MLRNKTFGMLLYQHFNWLDNILSLSRAVPRIRKSYDSAFILLLVLSLLLFVFFKVLSSYLLCGLVLVQAYHRYNTKATITLIPCKQAVYIIIVLPSCVCPRLQAMPVLSRLLVLINDYTTVSSNTMLLLPVPTKWRGNGASCQQERARERESERSK